MSEPKSAVSSPRVGRARELRNPEPPSPNERERIPESISRRRGTEAPAGNERPPISGDEIDRQMEIADQVMEEDREVLAALAK